MACRGTITAVYLVQRSCIHGSFLTTELVSLKDAGPARTLGVLDVDDYKHLFNTEYEEHTQGGV